FILAIAILPGAIQLEAQIFTPTLPPPAPPVQPSPNVNKPVRPPQPGAPKPGDVVNISGPQEADGPMKYVHGPKARLQTADYLLPADEIEYNSDTHEAVAKGNVYFESFEDGEKITAARAEYNTDQKTGMFYVVSGTYPNRIESRPGLLTTKNPF